MDEREASSGSVMAVHASLASVDRQREVAGLEDVEEGVRCSRMAPVLGQMCVETMDWGEAWPFLGEWDTDGEAGASENGSSLSCTHVGTREVTWAV
jgi:hypothetical protein